MKIYLASITEYKGWGDWRLAWIFRFLHMALLRKFIAIGLLSWLASLFIIHEHVHSSGCMTESAWANQNDEYYDRELMVE